MKLTENCVIMNFDNAYCGQDFYKETKCQLIDATSLRGTDCYCDEEGKNAIRKLIGSYPVQGIHYIDSGNYHYVSELWLEKVKEPFVLVVFDHHTDMQTSLFENLLSCGSWVKVVIDTNPYLRKVFLIGAREELIQQIPTAYQDKVICYSEKTCKHDENWQQYLDLYYEIPFYISIDKDVLSKKDAVTNWDQGTMTMEELEAILRHIIYQHKILGIDICGEYATQDNIMQMLFAEKLNNKANEELLTVIEETVGA